MNALLMLTTEVSQPVTFGELAGIALIALAILIGLSILFATLDDGWPFKKK
jgi:hypothetical protein